MQGDPLISRLHITTQAAWVYAHKRYSHLKAIGGIYTEILQRQCGKERIYVDKKNDSTSRRGGNKTRIIVERIYNGTQDMEEVFRTINEQNAVNNIRTMMQDKMKCDDTYKAQNSTKTA